MVLNSSAVYKFTNLQDTSFKFYLKLALKSLILHFQLFSFSVQIIVRQKQLISAVLIVAINDPGAPGFS